MEFKIINIAKHHKDQIYKLIKDVNREDNFNYSLTDEWLDYVIDNNSQGIFLGFCGDRLAGLGTCMINSSYRDQASLNVVVSPDHRRKGLGSMLYDKVYDFAKSEDVRVVEAYVKERLASGISFAEKRAFNTTLYCWEMELDLNSVNFVFEQLIDLNFRRVNRQDGLNYKRIIYNAFEDELGEDALMEILKDPSVNIYILEKDNQPIGSATVQLRERLSLAYIYDIAILKEYRGRGLGSYLLQSCIMDLKDKNIGKASLSVTGDNNRALELYRKIGFKEVDTDLIMVQNVEQIRRLG